MAKSFRIPVFIGQRLFLYGEYCGAVRQRFLNAKSQLPVYYTDDGTRVTQEEIENFEVTVGRRHTPVKDTATGAITYHIRHA